MGNDVKNEPVANRKQFTQDYQPTPEAKSKGWEKRRIKQEIMDLIARLDIMTMAELDGLRKDIELNPSKHSVREARLVRYMTREKFLIDYLDRNTGKAPQDIDVTSKGEKIDTVVVKFIHGNNETSNGSNGDSGEDDTTREEV